MYVSGKIRSNAPQLGDYTLKKGDNQSIYILDVNGNRYADAAYLKDTLYSMELNSELTRTKNSVYHAIIRPDPKSQQDRAMTMEEWHRATEILIQETPFKNQSRATILHELDGCFHAHMIIERYDHETGKMIDFKFNYRAHDIARAKMEREFNHERTPQKNPRKDNHKQTLTAIWRKTATGEEFIKEANKSGYLVTRGTDRPFRVVDSNGTSFDLVRLLDGVKTKEVRERLAAETLMEDKQAIKETRSQGKEKAVGVKEHKALVHDATVELPVPVKDSEPEQQTIVKSQKTEIELERQKFLEEIRKAREQNERSKGLLRTFCISALLMLRMAIERQTVFSRPICDLFASNRVSIVRMVSNVPKQNLGFVETAQFYKPT